MYRNDMVYHGYPTTLRQTDHWDAIYFARVKYSHALTTLSTFGAATFLATSSICRTTTLDHCIMPLSSFTMTAILANWRGPRYDGTQDAQVWVVEIDKGCDIYGIPIHQRVEAALHFMDGEPKAVMEAIRVHKLQTEKAWSWEEFQTDLIAIDSECVSWILYSCP